MTFASIVQVGLKQWRRSYSLKEAKKSSLSSGKSDFYSGSSVYNNYLYQSFLLVPFGFIGPFIILANSFIKDRQVALLAFGTVVSTGPIGFVLLILSILKSYGRQ